MWLCEDKLKEKTAHFRLPSASQKRACLSSLLKGWTDVTVVRSPKPNFLAQMGYRTFLPMVLRSSAINNLVLF